MRTPLSLTSILFTLFLLTSVESAFGQNGFAPPGPYGSPEYMPNPYLQGPPRDACPAPIAPGFNMQTGYADFGGGGNPMVPPGPAATGYQPYPGVDLYQYGMQQHINKGGLWYSNKSRTQRKYKAGVSSMTTWFERPETRMIGFGDPDDVRVTIGGNFFLTDNVQTGQIIIINGIVDMLDPDNTSDYNTLEEFRGIQPQFTTEAFKNDLRSNGFKLEWGYEDEDGSGLELNGWYAGQQTDKSVRGNTDPLNGPLAGFFDVRNINAYNPFLTVRGTFVPAGAPGTLGVTPIRFDRNTQLTWRATAFGTGLTLVRPTIKESSWYKLRPTFGVRYVNMQEAFNFLGQDSGAVYDRFLQAGVDDCGDPGEDPCGQPDIATITNPGITPVTAPYNGVINTRVETNLAGPEMGLRLDVGQKDSLNFWLQVSGGLAAKNENIKLDGEGIYEHLLLPSLGFADPFPDNAPFSSEENTTQVSPIFETSVNAEFPIHKWLPFTKRYSKLEGALFRVNYTFFYAGNIARAFDSVEYVEAPANPNISPDRQGFRLSQLGFAFDWTY